jgi:hypothetical protein
MDNMLDQIFGLPYKNKFTGALLPLFLIVFGAFAAPNLPTPLAKLYDQMWFKVLAMFLIAYMSTKNQTVSIIAAVVVLISLQALSKIKIENKLMQNGFIGKLQRKMRSESETSSRSASEMESPVPVFQQNKTIERMPNDENDNENEHSDDDTTETFAQSVGSTSSVGSNKDLQQDETGNPETHCFGKSGVIKGWNGNGEFAQY